MSVFYFLRVDNCTNVKYLSNLQVNCSQIIVDDINLIIIRTETLFFTLKHSKPKLVLHFQNRMHVCKKMYTLSEV